MAAAWRSPRDWLKWLLFELGAGYYARKLATGPEADLRHEFADFLALPPVESSAAPLRVLDVGCGPGHLARLLARRGCRVTGVDRGWRLLRIARRWATREGVAITFERADAEKLPFPTGAFDLTLATTVIYFVMQPAAVLAEMARVTRAGGTVASLDPHASMSRAAVREFALKERLAPRDARKLLAWAMAAELNRRFEEKELRSLFAKAGLMDVQLERRLGGMVWFSRGIVARKL